MQSIAKSRIDEASFARLFAYLGGLPLAISQAGAYMQETGASLQTYLRLYQQQWDEIHKPQHEGKIYLEDYGGRSVWTTWAISYKAILAKDEHAAHLLLLWSYIDHKDLWHGLFERAADVDSFANALSRWLGNIPTQETAFISAMGVLRSYSLIECTHKDSYSMHSVVHKWAYFCQGHQFQRELRSLAVAIIGSAVPYIDENNSSATQRRLMPHAQACVHQIHGLLTAILSDIHTYTDEAKNGRGEIDILRPIADLGDLFHEQGKYVEAEQIYTGVLQVFEKGLGPDAMYTIDSVHQLGILLRNRGNFPRAEQLLTRALQSYEKAVGLDHKLTLDVSHSLEVLYNEQGRLKEAEQMYTRALEGYEKALGPEHLSALSVVHGLANLNFNQGKLEQTEQMYARALQGHEKTLGLDHVNTLEIANHLGNLYRNQGKLLKAEQMLARSLTGFEQALDQDHTLTLDTIYDLGRLYHQQGKLKEAEQMFIRAMQGYEEALGPDHTRTLHAVYGLGVLYDSEGKLKEAEQMYIRELQGYEKTLGPDHKITLQAASDLRKVQADMNKSPHTRGNLDREASDPSGNLEFESSFAPASSSRDPVREASSSSKVLGSARRKLRGLWKF